MFTTDLAVFVYYTISGQHFTMHEIQVPGLQKISFSTSDNEASKINSFLSGEKQAQRG